MRYGVKGEIMKIKFVNGSTIEPIQHSDNDVVRSKYKFYCLGCNKEHWHYSIDEVVMGVFCKESFIKLMEDINSIKKE